MLLKVTVLKINQLSFSNKSTLTTEIFQANMPRAARIPQRRSARSTTLASTTSSSTSRTTAVAPPASGVHTTPSTSNLQPTTSSSGIQSVPSFARASSSPTTTLQHETSFSNEQIAKIQSLIQSTLRDTVEEVTTKAAQAATALAGIQQQSCNTGAESASAPPAPRPASYAALPIQIEGTLHNPTSATSSHSASSVDGGFTPEIPASYVRSIQNGEFFDLAKLLPQNLQRLSTFENENVSLMVGPNSELKLAMTPSNSRLKQIDNIEDWTTAFTMFMKVFVKKFPNKASEFIEYLDIIRYAAKYHRSYGWLIYDYKFRHKAANDKSIAWGEVDQQLWVRVFTVNQAQLFEDCSI